VVGFAPVSVVIPTYNTGRFVVEAIESVLAQTAVPSQIIIVDDGSTDDTADRLAKFGSRIAYLSQENGGASAARNSGVRAAEEEFVAFLDADDIWHPRKIETQLSALRSSPEIQMLGTRYVQWPGSALADAQCHEPPAVTIVPWESLVIRTSLLTSSVIVLRAMLSRVGEFDTALNGPEDRDLFLRIAEMGTVAILERELTGYREVAGSLSKQAKSCEQGMLTILRRLDDRGAWRDRPPLLRRRAYSHMFYSSAINHAACGMHAPAFARLLKSILYYPLPHGQTVMPVRFARAKSLAVQTLRLMHLKTPAAAAHPA
jgi:glycosyltransferase involved in cell wall biosynthesis